MNILTQLCGFCLLMVVLVFYVSHRRIHIKTARAFKFFWLITLLNVILDIISIVLLTHRDSVPDGIVFFECKLYLVSIVWEIFATILYLSVDVVEKRKRGRLIVIIYSIIAGVVSVVDFFLPIYSHISGIYDIYTYGPAVVTIYVLAGVSFLVAIFIVLLNKNVVNPRRRKVMWIWIAMWLAAAITQFLDNSILIISYAETIGVIVIYLCLENPEAHIDRESGMFNRDAFHLYMHQHIVSKSKYGLLGLNYSLGAGDNISSDSENSIQKEIATYLLSIPSAEVFRTGESDYVIVFEEPQEAERVLKNMIVRFERPWGKDNIRMVMPYWFLVKNPDLITAEEDLEEVFKYCNVQRNNVLGNNLMMVDEAVMDTIRQKRNAEAMLISAIKEDRVEVFYQAIYSTKSYKFASAEALVRIRDENGELVPPMKFIPVAEETGLIIKLGEMVFEKVCRFISEKNPMQYGLEYVEVNLSVVQCGYEKLASKFIDIMKRYDINPKCINLEITETASLVERKTLLKNMNELIDYGIEFSLDDFGTGHSNLNYIVDMPVSIVKFDRAMIQSYFSSNKAKYVMDAAMHMVHGIGLYIVAEGIETEEQYSSMEKLGIAYIQGYYFSKPVPEKEFITFIEVKNGPF